MAYPEKRRDRCNYLKLMLPYRAVEEPISANSGERPAAVAFRRHVGFITVIITVVVIVVVVVIIIVVVIYIYVCVCECVGELRGKGVGDLKLNSLIFKKLIDRPSSDRTPRWYALEPRAPGNSWSEMLTRPNGCPCIVF